MEELAGNRNFRLWWREAVLAGLATSVDREAVERETNRLVELDACLSDDEHVVALAMIGGARLVYSNDGRLHRDFKNRDLINNPTGKVYSTLRSQAFTRGKRKLLAGSACN